MLMRTEVISLKHLPTQEDFFYDKSRLSAYVGGIGTGKTYVASDKLLATIIRYPLARYFILSNTFAQLKSGTMMTFFARCRHWGFEYVDRIREKYVIVQKWVGPQLIRAKIECWTADDYELFRSLEVDFAWLDEGHVWPKMAFLTILGRLRGYEGTRDVYGDIGQQLWVTANPPHTTDHWLVDFTTKPPNEADDELMALVGAIEQECTESSEAAPPMKLFTSSTFDNPFLSKAYIRTLLETMDPELVDIELKGNFGDIGKGKIWRSFSRGRHIVDASKARDYGIPALEWDPNSEVCWSQDFNIDPLCTIIFQWRRVKVAGFQAVVMYVLDEMRIRDARIEHAAQEFGNRVLPLQIARRNGLVLYGDPSGDQRSRQTGESDWIALRKGLLSYGLSISRRIPPAAPLRRNRYNATNAKLVNGLGEIGVVIHPRCKYLAIDLNSQFYKPGTSDPLVKKAEDGATNTHFGDAFSYPIAEDFPVAAPAQGADPRR
jgi:hypothetical protein